MDNLKKFNYGFNLNLFQDKDEAIKNSGSYLEPEKFRSVIGQIEKEWVYLNNRDRMGAYTRNSISFLGELGGAVINYFIKYPVNIILISGSRAGLKLLFEELDIPFEFDKIKTYNR